MPYVTLEDYALSVSHEELTDVLTQAADGFSLSDVETRELAESQAEAVVNNFLAAKFDLAVEFAKTGSLRSMQLVSTYIDLVLCRLYKSVSPDDIPEMRGTACDEAVDNLSKWRDGEYSLIGVDLLLEEDRVGRPEFINPIKFISKPEADPLVFEDPTT